MATGICCKCGASADLILESYDNPISEFMARRSGDPQGPLRGVCAICSNDLDRQWAGAPTADWVLTNSMCSYLFRNITYTEMKSHWATHSGADLRPATAEEIEGKGPIPVSPSMQYIDEETKLWVRWGFFWACEDCVTPFDGVWDEDAQRRFKEADQEIRTRIEQLGHQHETPHYESYENFFASSKNERVAESTEAGRGLSQVAGMTNLKEQLMHEVIGPFKDPELYRRYRVSLPNGILFFGPPGCGKTYIARALADELGWHFQYCRPSDVASPYIHDTVSKIRAVFSTAIEKAPAIVFIDEFEAFVPARSELGGHQQYKAEEVNEFLANLEGCAERKVLVIAATNEPEKIDPAVRRSGRFDKLILVPLPDAEARQAMLELHLQDRPVDGSVDMAGISAALEGYSASDIKLLVDEAARIALKRKELIQTGTLLAALERVPSSITAEDMQRYDGFRSRGTG